jgi:hypothetical protein
MAIPKPENDFNIDVVTVLRCKVDCENCDLEKHIDIEEDTRKAYFNGTITDHELIKRHLENFEEFLKDKEKKIYVLDSNCYGEDIDALISELKPTDEERKGLEVVLEKVDSPVVVSKATPNKVLSMFWDEYGIDAIKAIVGDEATAERLFKTADSSTTPSQVLREATILTNERDIISALPKYRSLPPIAKFADNIARIYLTQGKDDVLRAIEHYKGGDTRIKSVAYAFLLALDQGASKKWQYTRTEIDFANFLKEPALKLLNSTPKVYHNNLQRLLSATGSTKKITSD